MLMRGQRLFGIGFTAVMLALAPTLAAAQQDPPPPQPPPVAIDPDVDIDVDDVRNEFIVSGFIGSNFGQDAADESVDFGGSFDYLRDGLWGFEFMANFAPNFALERPVPTFVRSDDIWVNNYMFNFIGAGRFGDEGRWRPYLSAGIGALTLNAENVELDEGQVEEIGEGAEDLLNPDETRFGGNIGGGIMAFTERIGFRADLRYLTDLEDESVDTDQAGLFSLADVSFWRATAGVAFRF